MPFSIRTRQGDGCPLGGERVKSARQISASFTSRAGLKAAPVSSSQGRSRLPRVARQRDLKRVLSGREREKEGEEKAQKLGSKPIDEVERCAKGLSL